MSIYCLIIFLAYISNQQQVQNDFEYFEKIMKEITVY